MQVGVTQTGRGVVDENFALTRTVEVEFHDFEWLARPEKYCGCCLHRSLLRLLASASRLRRVRHGYSPCVKRPISWSMSPPRSSVSTRIISCRSFVTGMPACAVA